MKAVKKLQRELKKPAYTQLMRKPRGRERSKSRLSSTVGYGRNIQSVGK